MAAAESELEQSEALLGLTNELLSQLGHTAVGPRPSLFELARVGEEDAEAAGDPEVRFAADGSGPSRREIGHEAQWTLSSAKMGNGVQQLRDGDLDTFWQSDGQQPHVVNVQFHKVMKIQAIALYLDISRDDSYTPQKLSIRIGSGPADTHEVAVVDCKDPQGWVLVNLPVGAPNSPMSSSEQFLRGRLVQILILASHQNGRDTHIRQVKIYGPRRPLHSQPGLLLQFSSEYFKSRSRIR